MSLRDEMTDKVRELIELDALTAWRLSDALVPLVERAVRKAAIAGWAAHVFCERGDKDYKTTEEIVADILK